MDSGPVDFVFEQTRPALKAEFLPNVEAVDLGAQAQPLGDLLGSQPLPEQAKDFKLPIG